MLALLTCLISAAPVSAATRIFTFTGAEQTYTVPAGASALHVVAVGAKGGTGFSGGGFMGGPGGNGAHLEADIPVTPGQILFVEVGGNGADGTGMAGGGAGGFNGGGSSSSDDPVVGQGGGGGGATDVRTCSLLAPTCAGNQAPLATRLLVAGGGGGGGGEGRGKQQSGGEGGAASQTGADGQTLDCGPQTTPGKGGGAGTGGAGGSGGAGGVGTDPAAPPASGGAGSLGLGGNAGFGPGNEGLGGGGGGGYFGGGAGGSADSCNAGGGGGGSSFAIASARHVSITADSTGVPEIAITPVEGDMESKGRLRLGKLSQDRRKGTASLEVEVTGPGALSLVGKGIVTQHRVAKVAGTVRLSVKATGRSARRLRRRHVVSLKATITFTPTGGESSSQSRTIRLVRGRR